MLPTTEIKLRSILNRLSGEQRIAIFESSLGGPIADNDIIYKGNLTGRTYELDCTDWNVAEIRTVVYNDCDEIKMFDKEGPEPIIVIRLRR